MILYGDYVIKGQQRAVRIHTFLVTCKQHGDAENLQPLIFKERGCTCVGVQSSRAAAQPGFLPSQAENKCYYGKWDLFRSQ